MAGSEAVIYGNRGIEFQYLNPIMPYHVAEHHLGDHDNNTMSFDITAFPINNYKFYLELFLDDFTLSRNPLTYYGNKFAFLLGGYCVEPFDVKNLDFRIEYTRIEPYVYTHKDSINQFLNYDQIIGHWLGPDADNWFTEINYRPHRDLKFSFNWEYSRKGSLVEIKPYQIFYNEKKTFLKEVVEYRHNFGFKIINQLFRDMFLSLNGYWIRTSNLDHIKDKKSSDSQVTVELFFNY